MASVAREVICGMCGAVYMETLSDFGLRDRDSFSCDCGHRIKEWDGTAHPIYRLVAAGRRPVNGPSPLPDSAPEST